MTIEAKVIADSISPAGIRLTTFQLRYPRFIHAELMTHRVFSRNASSSRAIPVEKMIAELKRDPAMPVFWGANQKGMQAHAEVTDLQRETCKNIWLNARDVAIQQAELLIKQGLHKQIANRILEPWAHINVVVTATDWANFFALRIHPDAQPELRELAMAMLVSREASTPQLLQPGEWHLPYVRESDRPNHPDALKAISVARCARVSYLTHDGKETTPFDDLKLFERLLGSQPLHASPAEHQATPDVAYYSGSHEMGRPEQFVGWEKPHLHGNLRGWIQYRKMLPGEFIPG